MTEDAHRDLDLDRFHEWVEAHIAALQRYCSVKTGSDWDAEDLIQETLIKAYRWHERHPDRELTRAFLFRIAANAWIDLCRQRQRRVPEHEMNEQLLVAYTDWHVSDVREALELLSDRLEPRQVVFILLMDVFCFTAKETAKLFGSSEGAVQAALHRARRRLKQAAENHPEYWDDPEKMNGKGLSVEVFEAFVNAFRQADPLAIYHSYQSMIVEGMNIDSMALQGAVLYFTFKDPFGNLLMVSGSISST